MKDLVSIVIPAYNASNYLAEAIESALAQTYENIEIIVVNDGSPDDGATRRVALSFGDKIRYYEKENGGCASALNYGISVMNGKWFSWLSHDDLYKPTKVSELLSLLDQYTLTEKDVVLGCNDVILNAEGKYKRNLFNNSSGIFSPEKAFGETLNIKTFNGCGLLIPKAIIDEVGLFRTDYKHLLDREYWMRIAIRGYSFVFSDNSLVVSRTHNQQITIKAKDALYSEEAALIDEYSTILRNDATNVGFLKELCFFAYKRKHYDAGKKIKLSLKKTGNVDMKTEASITKFVIEGVLKGIIRDKYKALLRK